MGVRWSQNRRKSSLSLPGFHKKMRPSATDSSQFSAEAMITGSTTQSRSCKPQHEFLTDDEQSALIKSWEKIKSNDLQLVGVKVLTRIFELQPETKQTFSNFKNLSTMELLENSKFRSHAIRFMRAVEVTMENLDALDVIIIPNLKHLGQLHTDISGFKLSYLKAVELAMDETWNDILSGRPIVVHGYINHSPNNSPNNYPYDTSNNTKGGDENSINYDLLMRNAWMKIFRLITSKMTEGYKEGVENKLAKEKMKITSQGYQTHSSSKQLCSNEQIKEDLQNKVDSKEHRGHRYGALPCKVVMHCHGNKCEDGNDINFEMEKSGRIEDDNQHHQQQNDQNNSPNDSHTKPNNNWEGLTNATESGNR